MNQPFDDELLSAYLDGELTGDERARVEQWLADQHEARQLLEELESVRRSLAALPTYRLDEDLTERVVRRAERTVLSAESGQSSQDAPKDSAAIQPAVVSVREAARGADRRAGGNDGTTWSLARLRRPLAYAAVAIAAAVMLMFVQDGREANRVLRERVAAGGAALDAIDDDDAPQLAERAAARDELDRVRDAESESLSRTPATRFGGASEARATPHAIDDARVAERSLADTASDVAVPASPAVPPTAAARTSAGEGEAAAFYKSFAASTPAEAPLNYESEATTLGFPAIEALDRSALNDMLVVQCEITPSAAQQQLFQQVLRRNSITFESAAAGNERDSGGEMPTLATKVAGAAAAGGGFGGERPAVAPAGEAALARQEALGVQAANEPSDVEIVYVEATAEQLHAMLSELSAEQDAFPAVEVQPAAANVAQQAWRGLSRTNSQSPARQRRALGSNASEEAQSTREAIASQEPEITEANRRQEQSAAQPPQSAPYFAEESTSQQFDSAARSDAGATAADAGGAEPIHAPNAFDYRAGQTGAASATLEAGAPPVQQSQPVNSQAFVAPLQNRSWAQRVRSDGPTAQSAQAPLGEADLVQSRPGVMRQVGDHEVARQAARGEPQAAAGTPAEPVTTQSAPQNAGKSVPGYTSSPSYQRALFFLRVVPPAQ